MSFIQWSKKCIVFLRKGIWRVSDSEVGRVRYLFYNGIKIVILTVRRFFADGIMTRAAALTYSTLFSVVPILALLFAIARGFGFQNLLEQLFRSDIGIEGSTADMFMGFIDSYLNRSKSGLFIGIGLFLLLWSVISLISNIEQNMNFIWQVHKPRSLFRKITDYCSLIVLIPIFIVASAGISVFMTTFLKGMENYELIGSTLRHLIQMAPYFLAGLIFTGMFIFIPNTKVRFIHAVIPGFIVGISFQAFQYFYIHSQLWVSSYNAIYGSFAAIPLFLLWANISWSIVLFGVQMSYISQNVQLFNFDKETKQISRRYQDFLYILIMSLICKRFSEPGKRPYSAGEISSQSNIPIRLVSNTLYRLQLVGLLYEHSADEKSDTPVYFPAIDIQQLTVAFLLDKIRRFGNEDFKVDKKQFSTQWEAVERAYHCSTQETENVLLKDLVL